MHKNNKRVINTALFYKRTPPNKRLRKGRPPKNGHMFILEVHRVNNSTYSLFLELFYNHYKSRVWWCTMPIIPVLKRLRQKGLEFGQAWVSGEFQGILGCTVRFNIEGGLVIQPTVNEIETIPPHLWWERMNSVWCVYVLIDHALKYAQCLTCICVCWALPWTHRLYCTKNHAKWSPRILPQWAWGRAWRVVSNVS